MSTQPSKKEKQNESKSFKGKVKSKVSNWTVDFEQIKVDTRRAVIGGLLAAVTMMAGAWIVGEASGRESLSLLQTSLETTRSFCGTITLALGNILALMLTLLSLSASADIDLKWEHYQRVKQIGWVDSVVLIASILIYLLLNIPLGEADGKGMEWYEYAYYATLILSSLLGGALITVVLMLYNTVKDLILVFGPTDHDHLIDTKKEREEKKKKQEEESKS